MENNNDFVFMDNVFNVHFNKRAHIKNRQLPIIARNVGKSKKVF